MVPPMLKPVVTMPNTRRPPRLGERLHLSYGQVAWDDCHGRDQDIQRIANQPIGSLSYGQVGWDDCHGEGFRTPALTGRA